ncbi:rbcL, partial [Symbiodinium sp. CCMP2456]
VKQQQRGAEAGKQPAMSVPWLQKHSKVSQCKLWKELGSGEGSGQLVASLAAVAAWFQEWKESASHDTLHAYIRHLSLTAEPPTHPRVQRTILRLLRLAARRRSAGSDWEALLTQLDTRLLEPILPQILAYMNSPDDVSGMSTTAAGLFARVATASPHTALFPALAAQPPRGLSTVMPGAAQAREIVAKLHPELLPTAELFATSLNAMAIPIDEVALRLVHLAESFLASRPPEQVVDAAGMILRHFASLLDLLDSGVGEECCFRSILPASEDDEVLAFMGCVPCLTTAYARRFLSLFLPPFRRLLFLHRPYLANMPQSSSARTELTRSLLSHLRLLQRTCSHFARASSVPLAELSPALLGMFQNESGKSGADVVLPIPTQAGTADQGGLMSLRRASGTVQMLSTKTKPKKLDFEAQDGSWHSFLLKGAEKTNQQEVETVAAEGLVAKKGTSAETLQSRSMLSEPSDVFAPIATAPMSPRSESTSERVPSPAQAIDPRRPALGVDQGVLRAVPVRKLLRPGMWRRRAIISQQEGDELYGQSKPVEALGAFLSHNWEADGSSKVVALTLQTSWPLLLACWLLVACVFFTLGLLEILPMPFIN